jgi:hypothetical protein
MFIHGLRVCPAALLFTGVGAFNAGHVTMSSTCMTCWMPVCETKY